MSYMPYLSQILYIGEVQTDGTNNWNFCVRYDEDNYFLYGFRSLSKNYQTKMSFHNSASLVRFLKNVCDINRSIFNIALYLVDMNHINEDNYFSYYEAYDKKYELVEYNDIFSSESLTDLLSILRDTFVWVD